MNYRGSIGFGTHLLESLLGKIGSQDVDDCLQALQHYVDFKGWKMSDCDVFVTGGSHGGFLTAHLASLSSSSLPKDLIFLAAALRYFFFSLS